MVFKKNYRKFRKYRKPYVKTIHKGITSLKGSPLILYYNYTIPAYLIQANLPVAFGQHYPSLFISKLRV
jgi:hypothetical protein